MRDLDINTTTAAVLAQMADTPDPRLRQIMAAAVQHLHDFARELNLTPEEWLKGIAFMTQVGQTCTPHRQEFILLSDVLGLSRLVDVMHDGAGREELGTESSLLGPFFRESAPEIPLGGSLAREPGRQEIVIYGQVRDTEGAGVGGAVIDLWQTSDEGLYDLQANDPSVMDHRGRITCDASGQFHLRSCIPLGYSIPMDGPVGALVRAQARHGMRPGHIHVLVAAAGYRELVTALYLGDDPHVDSDTVFGVSDSLVITPTPGLADNPLPHLHGIHYDFTLSRATGEGTGRVGSDPSKLMRAAE